MTAAIPGNTTSTTSVAVGATYNGNLDSIGDQDYIRVSLTAGVTYTVILQGVGTGANTLGDPLIDGIYTTNNVFRGGFSNDGIIGGTSGRDSSALFTAATTENHWIAVAGDMDSTGTYSLRVLSNAPAGADSVPGDTSSNVVVAVGGSANGEINTETDADWYRVSLTAGNTYTFRMRGQGTGTNTLGDPLISGIYTQTGIFIPNTYVDDLNNRDAAVTYKATYTGVHFVSTEGARAFTGSFTFDVTQIGTEVPGTTATTATLAIGGNATVTIDAPFDHDWYAVSLTAGTTYRFTLAGTAPNSLPGIYGIYNASGTYVDGYSVAANSGTSSTATTIFTPTTSGTYYIDAFSNFEGDYTLSAATDTADVKANTTTTATVAVGGSVTGDIGSATDIDWIAVTLVGGTSYTIKMQGKGTDALTLADPLISGIYNSTGTVIADTYSDDEDGSDAFITFRAPASGTYYIAAEGYGAALGTYSVSVTQIAADVGQTTSTATALTMNSSTTGTIEDASDVDWYSVSLAAGTTYYVKQQGSATSNGTLYDPLLNGLHDATGTYITGTMNDDFGTLRDSAVVYTAAASGTHFISTGGFDDSTGTFKVSIENDAGTSTATAWAMSGAGSFGGTIGSASDMDWYKFSLVTSTSYVFKMTGDASLGTPSIARVLNSVPAALSPVLSTSGNTSIARIIPTAAGDHYVELDNVGTATGTFVLTMQEEPGDTMATAKRIITGVPTWEAIDDPTDIDWFSVNLAENMSYAIKMLGTSSGNGGTLSDPFITSLRVTTGATTTSQVLAGTDNSTGYGNDSVMRYTVPSGATNTYYVVADPAGAVTGTYTIQVDIEAGASNSTSIAVQVGGSITAAIDDATDQDWYAVTLVAGRTYRFDAKSTGGTGSLVDTYINGIRNSAGTVQTNTTQDGGGSGLDASVSFTPSASGTYYVNIDNGVSNSSAVGTYIFSVVQTNPAPQAFPMAMIVGVDTSDPASLL